MHETGYETHQTEADKDALDAACRRAELAVDPNPHRRRMTRYSPRPVATVARQPVGSATLDALLTAIGRAKGSRRRELRQTLTGALQRDGYTQGNARTLVDRLIAERRRELTTSA